MSARIAFVSAVLLVMSAAAHSQPRTPSPPRADVSAAPPAAIQPNWPTTPPAPPVTPLGPTAVPPPREKFVDELLAELEDVQARKAALEKQEAELKAAVRKKLDAQAERLKKLGVTPQPAKDKEPDRVGKVIIEGNTKTRDDKILALVELRPGQVLPYPELEAARARLTKAGFRDVTVEALPGELDSTFKDVRVKVTEADKR